MEMRRLGPRRLLPARLLLGFVVVADALQAPQAPGSTRPTRGYSVGLAERSSTSTAFFEPEPGFEEERTTRGIFEKVYPGVPPEPIEDFWEPYLKSGDKYQGHMSPDRLRSSDLNELLKPDFLEAKRYDISPMQAIGAMFKDETVLSGIHELNKESWRVVAQENQLPPPGEDALEISMGMLPERAIQQTFMWTDDWGETRKWGCELREAYARMLPDANFNATPGAVDWLTALNQYEVPCVVCSSVARAQLITMLEKAGLGDLFQEIVAADDGCETTEQAYLLACLKIRRPPNKCVVFADEPQEVSVAHDATAKVIAVVGKHSGNGGLRRDFSHADLRVGGLDELRISQLKEVADRETEQSWMMPMPEPFWGDDD